MTYEETSLFLYAAGDHPLPEGVKLLPGVHRRILEKLVVAYGHRTPQILWQLPATRAKYYTRYSELPATRAKYYRDTIT